MQAGVTTDAWKRNIGDYLTSAEDLYLSMRRFGFDPDHSVPIDPAGELLNGSHRVACALALGIEEIPVIHEERRVWAPAWDAAWFQAHGLAEQEIAALIRIVENNGE